MLWSRLMVNDQQNIPTHLWDIALLYTEKKFKVRISNLHSHRNSVVWKAKTNFFFLVFFCVRLNSNRLWYMMYCVRLSYVSPWILELNSAESAQMGKYSLLNHSLFLPPIICVLFGALYSFKPLSPPDKLDGAGKKKQSIDHACQMVFKQNWLLTTSPDNTISFANASQRESVRAKNRWSYYIFTRAK